MLRFSLGLLLLVPAVAFGQGIVPETPSPRAAWHGAEPAPPRAEAERAARPRLALVVQQADGNSCSSGSSCEGGDCSPDISAGSCGSGGVGDGCGVATAGCVVATGAAFYGIYRLIMSRRPRPDSLAQAPPVPGLDDLAAALRQHFDVTVGTDAAPGADVLLHVREGAPARLGLGDGGAAQRITVEAFAADGQPILLDAEPLPRARLRLDVDADLPTRARALAWHLASR
jgi:hypothetical protein